MRRSAGCRASRGCAPRAPRPARATCEYVRISNSKRVPVRVAQHPVVGDSSSRPRAAAPAPRAGCRAASRRHRWSGGSGASPNTAGDSCARSGSSNASSAAVGSPFACHLAVGEVARAAHVLAVEDLPVHPLEVDRQRERLAHAHVGELRAARVHREALHAGDVRVPELALDDLAATGTCARCDRAPSSWPSSRTIQSNSPALKPSSRAVSSLKYL